MEHFTYVSGAIIELCALNWINDDAEENNKVTIKLVFIELFRSYKTIREDTEHN